MLTWIAAGRRCRGALRFRRDAAGASAVEFALLLPVMLGLCVGMAEVAHAIDNWRKVTLLARTVADLTSQGDATNPIASSTMSDIFASAKTVLQPFKGSNAAIVVSALAVDLSASTINPRVCSSSATSNALARPVGLATDLKIPPSFLAAGNRYVLAEVRMPYTPMIGGALAPFVGGANGSFILQASFPWPVRAGTTFNGTTNEIILPGGAKCP